MDTTVDLMNYTAQSLFLHHRASEMTGRNTTSGGVGVCDRYRPTLHMLCPWALFLVMAETNLIRYWVLFSIYVMFDHTCCRVLITRWTLSHMPAKSITFFCNIAVELPVSDEMPRPSFLVPLAMIIIHLTTPLVPLQS